MHSPHLPCSTKKQRGRGRQCAVLLALQAVAWVVCETSSLGGWGARREEVRCGYVGVTLDVVPVVPGL